MACDLTLGRLKKCNDQAGGTKSVAFINNVDGLLDTATIAATDQITAFASALTMFKYEVVAETTSFEEVPDDGDNGTSSWTQTVTMVLYAQTLADRKELKLMQHGRPQVVVQGFDGSYKMVGIENGCSVKVTANGGTALNDPTGYTVVCTAREKNMAHYIDSTIIGDTTNTVVTVGT